MILIVDGPDGAGKTTLVKQLARQTGYRVHTNSYPKVNRDFTEMYNMYVDALKSKCNLIFDRSWYSEVVYGPILRSVSAITIPEMYELERLVARNGGLFIYCNASTQTLWKRCQERGEDYIKDIEQLSQVQSAFNQLVDIPHYIPVTCYEYKEV